MPKTTRYTDENADNLDFTGTGHGDNITITPSAAPHLATILAAARAYGTTHGFGLVSIYTLPDGTATYRFIDRDPDRKAQREAESQKAARRGQGRPQGDRMKAILAMEQGDELTIPLAAYSPANALQSIRNIASKAAARLPGRQFSVTKAGDQAVLRRVA